MNDDGKRTEKKPYAGKERRSGKPGEKQSFSPRDRNRPTGKTYAKPGQKPFDRKPAPKSAPKPTHDPNAPSSLSRKVALEIFQDVVRKDAFASLSLDDRMKNANLSQLDKRFCASIVYTTLENLIRIDYVLSFFLKDADNLEATVRDIQIGRAHV